MTPSLCSQLFLTFIHVLYLHVELSMSHERLAKVSHETRTQYGVFAVELHSHRLTNIRIYIVGKRENQDYIQKEFCEIGIKKIDEKEIHIKKTDKHTYL